MSSVFSSYLQMFTLFRHPAAEVIPVNKVMKDYIRMFLRAKTFWTVLLFAYVDP